MSSAARPLTGRRVLCIAIGIFALVMAPNVVLTVLAVSTFSGLVVPNSYVASQHFDADRAAQQALGWTLDFAYADSTVRLDLTDAAGRVVRPATLDVVIGRPTTDAEDRALVLEGTPGGFAAAADLSPGNWLARIDATAADGTAFRLSRPFFVSAR